MPPCDNQCDVFDEYHVDYKTYMRARGHEKLKEEVHG
jgi:hypothetical protein